MCVHNRHIHFYLYHLHFVMLMSLAFLSDAYLWRNWWSRYATTQSSASATLAINSLTVSLCHLRCTSNYCHVQSILFCLVFPPTSFPLLQECITDWLKVVPTVYIVNSRHEGTVLFTFFQTNPWKRWFTVYIVSSHMV